VGIEYDNLFTYDDIVQGIGALKTNKSCGNSFVSPELLKTLSCPNMILCFVEFFNIIGKLGVPSDWNMLRITSLYKNKGS
jgi:hypothetical protein